MNCLDSISILSGPAQRKGLRRKQKRCANTCSGARTSPCLRCFVLFQSLFIMCSIIKCFGQREVSSLKFIIFIDGSWSTSFRVVILLPVLSVVIFLVLIFSLLLCYYWCQVQFHPNPGPNSINSVSNRSFKC